MMNHVIIEDILIVTVPKSGGGLIILTHVSGAVGDHLHPMAKSQIGEGNTQEDPVHVLGIGGGHILALDLGKEGGHILDRGVEGRILHIEIGKGLTASQRKGGNPVPGLGIGDPDLNLRKKQQAKGIYSVYLF